MVSTERNLDKKTKDMVSKLMAGRAPLFRYGLSRRATQIALFIGLIPIVVASVVEFGPSALGRFCLAACAAVIAEFLSEKFMRKPEGSDDFSAIVQGFLLALLLPPTAPAWLIVAGAFLMIVLGKQLFGGIGKYRFNPVVVGWAILLLFWGSSIYPLGGHLLGTAWTPAVFIGGVVLLVSGHIDWEVPIGVLLGVVIAAYLSQTLSPDSSATIQTHLISGSVFLGAFFLATDPNCSPTSSWPRFVCGLCAGLLIVILRVRGVWPEPVPIAILLMNALGIVFDRLNPSALRKVTRHA